MMLAANRVQNTRGEPKFGIVTSVHGGAVAVLLQPEEMLTVFMPQMFPWASLNAGFYAPPNIGDQVMILFQEGSKDVPVCIGAFFWNEAPAPIDTVAGQAKWFDASGAFIKLNNDGTITISPNASGRILIPGNLAITTVGKGLQIKEGTNAKAATATLSSGTVTVSNTSVTANSRILLTRQSNGSGTTAIGALGIGSISTGASFVINSYLNNASIASGDNSIVYYNIIEPA
jgi:phage baseplate assembly protein gpV